MPADNQPDVIPDFAVGDVLVALLIFADATLGGGDRRHRAKKLNENMARIRDAGNLGQKTPDVIETLAKSLLGLGAGDAQELISAIASQHGLMRVTPGAQR